MEQRVVHFALRDLEGEVAMRKYQVLQCQVSGQHPNGTHLISDTGTRGTEKGQSVLLFAILMPIMSLFLLGILDYMVTNARVMETVAAADLAAHAGAQEITVLPDGTITATTAGNVIAAAYFNSQRPGSARLNSVSCGRHQGRPACYVTAQVKSAGYLLPARWVRVQAIGYLAHGVTREDQ
jgi:Flp pilus assembly protein TadG